MSRGTLVSAACTFVSLAVVASCGSSTKGIDGPKVTTKFAKHHPRSIATTGTRVWMAGTLDGGRFGLIVVDGYGIGYRRDADSLISLRSEATQIAHDADRAVFSLHPSEGVVRRIVALGTPTMIERKIAEPGELTTLLADSGGLWVGRWAGGVGSIVLLNLDTLEPSASIGVAGKPTSLDSDVHDVYVALADADLGKGYREPAMARIDETTKTVTATHVTNTYASQSLCSVMVTDDAVWLATVSGVRRIDKSTLAKVTDLEIPATGFSRISHTHQLAAMDSSTGRRHVISELSDTSETVTTLPKDTTCGERGFGSSWFANETKGLVELS
jgi:DNA-binding beta-propeller fold protein YncE